MTIQPKHLGQKSSLITQYDPSLLEAIPRQLSRDLIALSGPLPFFGEDLWNAYEISWLNPKGKPIVVLGEFRIPCTSPNLIESKSFKLYLNSFNQNHYESIQQVTRLMIQDLSTACGAPVSVVLTEPRDFTDSLYANFPGKLIDGLDIDCTVYEPSASLLKTSPTVVSEVLTSDLLKSNCPVTFQPDWGSVQITYTGPQIDRASLLRYLVSFRSHNDFHEHCVERIFMDLMNHCHPETLTVYARYTRRGGLDINPYRTTRPVVVCPNIRLVRQ